MTASYTLWPPLAAALSDLEVLLDAGGKLDLGAKPIAALRQP
jgi:hypothetical protein